MKMRLPTWLLSASLFLPAFRATAQSTSYPGPAYQQPTQQSGGKIQALADKVAQLSANDQRQDVRLYHVERDVDKLQASAAPKPPPAPSSFEGGMAHAPALVPFVPYQVRKGDTLWRIAMAHRVSPGDVMAFNRMPNDTVVEGQTIMIPQKGAKPASGSAPAFFHTVQPNESFRSIAKKYGVTSEAIAKANPKVNPSKLMAGAKLAIPAGAQPPTPPKPPQMAFDNGLPVPPPSKPTTGTHVVAPGESLSVIAQKYKITTAALQKANKITDANSLRVGQKLTIPGGAASSPASVASKNSKGKAKAGAPTKPTPPVPPTNVAAAPVPPTPPEKPKPPTPPAPPPNNNRGVVAYRMEKGDTIDTVAQMFGTTGAEIRRLNRLNVNSPLREGDEILVPGMGPVAGN